MPKKTSLNDFLEQPPVVHSVQGDFAHARVMLVGPPQTLGDKRHGGVEERVAGSWAPGPEQEVDDRVDVFAVVSGHGKRGGEARRQIKRRQKV